jgi:hypothetical protein
MSLILKRPLKAVVSKDEALAPASLNLRPSFETPAFGRPSG